MGCMADFRGYPCPVCGFDPGKAAGNEYALPLQSILGSKYLVGKVLGQGGFGITYLGLDMTLERKVAIKEYYPAGQVSRTPGTRMLTWYTSSNASRARQEGMELFLKEARKMAKLEDIPGVVKVREVFLENETAYIVMDFVEGQTLKSLLKNGPLPWEQANAIFRPAIQSMEKVHKAGLVHRDLSPDNLMITPDGSVKILDLGAAKDLSVNSGASSMQVAKGGFSPFEQYTQRGGSGPWTDVYAMAATIYYTLTGVLPPAAMDRMEEDTIRWDYPGLQSLPAPALEALKKALTVQAKQRTQSMAQLERGLFAESKQSLPKWLIPAVAAAVVVLVVGIGVGTKMMKSANDYKAAQALMDAGEYGKAAEAFEALGDYEDSVQKTEGARQLKVKQEAYQEAQSLLDAGEYIKAAETFEALGDYADSVQKAEGAKLKAYEAAQSLLEAGEYVKAAEAFEVLGDYAESAQKAGGARLKAYEEAKALLDAGEYGKAMIKFAGQNYKDSAQLAQEAKQSYWATQRTASISAGHGHTVGLRSDSTAMAIGWNTYGACNVSTWRDIVAVAAGYAHTVGLHSNGTVVATGNNSSGQCDISDWRDIAAVAVGSSHTVGLRSDGTVVATGNNGSGQCDVSDWKDIVAVAAGDYHTVGLRSDGTLVATGANDYGDCDVSDWRDIAAVSAGGLYTVGLRSDGTVVSIGNNDSGQCDISGWRDIVAVAAGDYHTVGLRSDGTVVATGYNDNGQCDVSDWMDIVAVAAGGYHTVGLHSDGTVVTTGDNVDGRCDVSSWTDIRTP